MTDHEWIDLAVSNNETLYNDALYKCWIELPTNLTFVDFKARVKEKESRTWSQTFWSLHQYLGTIQTIFMYKQYIWWLLTVV